MLHGLFVTYAKPDHTHTNQVFQPRDGQLAPRLEDGNISWLVSFSDIFCGHSLRRRSDNPALEIFII